MVTRKLNEAVMIGDGIEIRVLQSGRDGIRLGITAPPHVAVHRQEVYEQIRAANSSAASSHVALQDVVARFRTDGLRKNTQTKNKKRSR